MKGIGESRTRLMKVVSLVSSVPFPSNFLPVHLRFMLSLNNRLAHKIMKTKPILAQPFVKTEIVPVWVQF